MNTLSKTIQKTAKATTYALLALFISFNFSCSPEDGANGMDGVQGEQGPTGEDGNANVIYSDWMTPDWNYANNPDYKGMLVDEPRVVENDFMNHGTLIVFMKQSNPTTGSAVIQLPYTFGNTQIYAAAVDATGVQGIIIFERSTDGQPVANIDDTAEFRYVLIPGGVPVNSAGRSAMDYTSISYDEIADYFGIDD